MKLLSTLTVGHFRNFLIAEINNADCHLTENNGKLVQNELSKGNENFSMKMSGKGIIISNSTGKTQISRFFISIDFLFTDSAKKK